MAQLESIDVPPPDALASASASASASARRHRRRDWLAGYLFILPDALGLAVFVGLPMVLSLAMAFFEVDGFGGYRFVGLANFRRMWLDPLFWQGAKVTLAYAVMLVPSLYVTGLGLALLVQRGGRFDAVVRSMFFAPQMVSLVVVAMVWQILLLDKVGLGARAFGVFGVLAPSFLGDPRWALFTLVLVSLWFLMGFYMLIFLGGLQDIPRDFYEAATLDGASPVQQFWFLTLPLLRPTSFFVLLVSTVTAAAGGQVFDLIWVMTKGGPANSTSALIVYIYKQAFQFNAFGYASAMASLLVVMLMLVTLVLFFLTRGGRFQYD